jgi:hypothetical protein
MRVMLIACVGFGLSVKTEADVLSVSKWDFASQIGVRFETNLQAKSAQERERHEKILTLH